MCYSPLTQSFKLVVTEYLIDDKVAIKRRKIHAYYTCVTVQERCFSPAQTFNTVKTIVKTKLFQIKCIKNIGLSNYGKTYINGTSKKDLIWNLYSVSALYLLFSLEQI